MWFNVFVLALAPDASTSISLPSIPCLEHIVYVNVPLSTYCKIRYVSKFTAASRGSPCFLVFLASILWRLKIFISLATENTTGENAVKLAQFLQNDNNKVWRIFFVRFDKRINGKCLYLTFYFSPLINVHIVGTRYSLYTRRLVP